METSAPDAPTWHAVCAAAELEPGRPRRFQHFATDLLIARLDGVAHAVDNICTHAYACLHEGRVRGARVICPLHGGAFDLRTGAAIGQPATQPLRHYELREIDGVLEVALPGRPR